jgi:hypothetical protein
MLTAEQVRKLERLRLYGTRYELAMTHTETRESLLIAYSTGKARRDVFRYVSDPDRVGPIVARTGSDSIHFGKRAADGGTMGEWSIRFTGRTQRQAITEGELPYIGS